MKKCQHCNGFGNFPLENFSLCGTCVGSGEVPSHAKLRVNKTVIVPMHGRLGTRKLIRKGDVGVLTPAIPWQKKAGLVGADFGKHHLTLKLNEVELF